MDEQNVDPGPTAADLPDSAVNSSIDQSDVIAKLEAAHKLEIAKLVEWHEAELRAVEAKRRAMVSHVKGSVQYQIGVMFVGLRGKAGWKALPKRMKSLWRRYRNTTPQHDWWEDVPVVPARRELALTILDEFSHMCFSPELQLRPASHQKGNEQFDGVDLVLTESAWRGNGKGWSGAFSRYGERNHLPLMLQEAKQRGIPTVFWNKEDPVNYDVFINAAKQFDHVFTTDADVIERYTNDLGHTNIQPLVFAAQPTLHHPMGRMQALSTEICFAGSWRGDKYPERVRALSELLEAAAETGDLVIYDRMKREKGSEEFGTDFTSFVRGSLSYGQVVKKYRHHAVFLNTNSVTNSSTMIARRVFEILACRTPVVSTPSLAVDHLFGDTVPSPTSKAEAKEVLASLMDPEARDRLAQRGYRLVHSQHTYQHRVDQIMMAIGKDAITPPPPAVDVLLCTNRPEHLAHALDNYRCQDHPNKRLILVTNSDDFDLDEVRSRLSEFPEAVLLSLPQERTLGECLNAALDHCKGEWFAKMDDDDWYGPAYLSDMLLTRNFSDASVIGKRSTYAYMESIDETVLRRPGQEFKYTDLVVGATLLVRRKDLGSIRFQSVPRGTDSRFLRDCDAAGLRIFSADRFNYMISRRRSLDSHTWQIDDDVFLKGCRKIGTGNRFDSAVV